MGEVVSRALWFVEPRRVELREERARESGPGEVLVRGLASAISQGTELLLYRGEGPEVFDASLPTELASKESNASKTSKEERAPSTYPRRYGYAWVGEVIGGEPALSGKTIFALASHAEHHVLRASEARVLPDGVPAERAVLAANLETAISCTWDAEVSLGDRAVVLGGGVVGALTAWLLARSGARVVLVERSARRRAAAKALAPGITVESAAATTPDGRADVVVEATGDPRTLDGAIAWCAEEARVVVASFYGRRRAAIDLGDAFHRRRLTLRSSQVSSIAPRLRARWTIERRWELVTSLLAEPALDALVGETVPFERAAEIYAKLDRDDDLPPAHVFVYR